MHQFIRLLAILLGLTFLSSCKNGGKIPEVKLIPIYSGSEFQYIDKEGKIIINPQFSEATVFRDGLALVKTSESGESSVDETAPAEASENPINEDTTPENESKWGFISDDGRFAISPNYLSATVFSDGLAWVVSKNAPPTAINNKGEVKVTLKDAEFVKIYKDGLSAFSIIDKNVFKWGFVDKEGEVKINPEFSNTLNFSDGKCAVADTKGKWGFIDEQGKILINYQFTKAKDFVNGTAVVFSSDNKAGLIDEKGKFIINPQFSDIIVDGDKYLVKQDNKWGWCDKEGKFLINPQFNDAYPFMGQNLAAVESGDNWAYIDTEGKININPQFAYALPFDAQIALVSSGQKFGFIDKNGKFVINPQYDKIPTDLMLYMAFGKSAYEMVETDFFNISSIVKRINIKSPEGLSLNSKLSQVVSTLKITENDFSQYEQTHLVIDNDKITKNASVSFYVLADAFTEVPDGWYTRNVFDKNAVVNGYAYLINLSGRGRGREKDVRDAIEKTLTGYKKDEEESTDRLIVYKNETTTFKSWDDGNSVIIVLEKNENPKYNDESEDELSEYPDVTEEDLY